MLGVVCHGLAVRRDRVDVGDREPRVGDHRERGLREALSEQYVELGQLPERLPRGDLARRERVDAGLERPAERVLAHSEQRERLRRRSVRPLHESGVDGVSRGPRHQPDDAHTPSIGGLCSR